MSGGVKAIIKDTGLTPKQLAFCEEYIKDSNLTQAAVRAGYSSRTAKAQSTHLFTNVAIRARIDELRGEQVQRTRVDADYVVNKLVSVVERCMQLEPVMVFNGKQLEQDRDEDGKGVFKFDSMGANKALELLGKHLPDFFNKKPEDQGNTVQWIENKTYIDQSQHLHTTNPPTTPRLDTTAPHPLPYQPTPTTQSNSDEGA